MSIRGWDSNRPIRSFVIYTACTIAYLLLNGIEAGYDLLSVLPIFIMIIVFSIQSKRTTDSVRSLEVKINERSNISDPNLTSKHQNIQPISDARIMNIDAISRVFEWGFTRPNWANDDALNEPYNRFLRELRKTWIVMIFAFTCSVINIVYSDIISSYLKQLINIPN